MSWRTSTIGIFARDVGRTLGVNRVVGRWRARGYEEHYDAQLSHCIRAGDVVWDIGANVGYYTTRFAAAVGDAGTVVAFEPSAINFARLEAACADLPRALLQPYGLGDADGPVRLQQGQDELGATSTMAGTGDKGELVDVHVGDRLISAGTLPQPNVVKMDVEGFEGEVVAGLADCLRSPALRAVGIEVHFGILAQRGLGRTPLAIESALGRAGFHVTWPDSSHILATR